MTLDDVAQHWQTYAEQHSIAPDLVSHLMQGTDSHPLTPQQQMDAAEIAHRCLHPTCTSHDCLLVSPGQPFRVKLLQAFATRAQDPDGNLGTLMHEGVPAGILQPIPSSMQWQQRQQNLQDDGLDDIHLIALQGQLDASIQKPMQSSCSNSYRRK